MRLISYALLFLCVKLFILYLEMLECFTVLGLISIFGNKIRLLITKFDEESLIR